MQIVRLHIHHSRYPSATRRVVPHPYRFPSDLGPEAGHVLCAAILTEFVPALDPVDREGLDLLLSTLETRPRPARALRHRVQHDAHGLDENLHSLGIESGGLSVRIDRHAPRRKSSGLSSDCPAWGTDTGWKRCRPPASRSCSREVGSQTSSTGSTPRRRRWGFPPRSARECGRRANWGSKSSTFGMPR